MNRFEHPHTTGRTLLWALPIGAFVVLMLLFLYGIQSVNQTTADKQQESLETALSRCISQCYATEGIYPPSLDYLKEHYGLLIDEDTFLVDYEYYGGNLLPEVTVLRRTTGKQ